jgi:rubrerythrin
MYSYQNHYYGNYRQLDDKLARDIERAINLKYNQINCYDQLVKQTEDDKTKAILYTIREDEARHYQQFQQFYRILTGNSVEAKITQVCGKTFKEGLEGAFVNEQANNRFYFQITDQTTNQTIKNVFYRAAAEDQGHSSWFLYYMIKNR